MLPGRCQQRVDIWQRQLATEPGNDSRRCWQQQQQQCGHLHPQLERHLPAAARGAAAAARPVRRLSGQHAEERQETAAGALSLILPQRNLVLVLVGLLFNK